LSKYRQLLLTKLGNKVSIYQFLMGTDDPAVYRERMGTNGANNKTMDATVPLAIKANTQLWKKVVELHLHDVDDIDHHVSSLRNALPACPAAMKIRFMSSLLTLIPRFPTRSSTLYIPIRTLLIISCHTQAVIQADLATQLPRTKPCDPHRDDHPNPSSHGRSPATAGHQPQPVTSHGRTHRYPRWS